jgi:hypothetical protein
MKTMKNKKVYFFCGNEISTKEYVTIIIVGIILTIIIPAIIIVISLYF